MSDEQAARALAEDWITIWRSELAALAADPEAGEAWHALLAPWAAALTRVPPKAADDGPARTAGADAQARPPAADTAPDPRERELADLRARVAELERAAVPKRKRKRAG